MFKVFFNFSKEHNSLSFMKKKNHIIFIFFFIYLLSGFFLYKDFGIGIEEHFQRQNGFFWLKNISKLFKLENISLLANNELLRIREYDPALPDPEFFNFYGIIFDLPLALVEIIFNVNDSKTYFEIRHLSIFLVFFVSSIFFYRILTNRFRSTLPAIIGTIFFILNPRIFGDSFYNSKDILFFSLLTIAVYYLFKLLEKFSYKNIILFCLFSAFATSSRIFAVYMPFLLIFFMFIECISKKIDKLTFFNHVAKILFFYLFFLYLHYPYMWEFNILNMFDWFNSFFYNMNYRILFNGEYYHIKYLPRSYLSIWILISTPLIIIFFSIFGFFLILKRFFLKVLKVEKNIKITNDFWSSINEKKDLYILISFTLFYLYFLFFNTFMVSGWRYFYFLYIFIIYFSSYSIYFLCCRYRKFINPTYNTYIFGLMVLFLGYEIYKFHPYESLYFNRLINKNNYQNFQIDTPSLSRSAALKYIVLDSIDKNKINVGNLSWQPFYNGKDLLNENEKEKLYFVGQDYQKADYLYTNYLYLREPKNTDKYTLPINFKKIYEFEIRGIKIYSIYKKY